MESFIIGITSVVIDATASIITVWIQTSVQAKRERLYVVMELALEDHKSSVENARQSGRAFVIPSVTLYLHYHLELAKEMGFGNIEPECLREIMSEN